LRFRSLLRRAWLDLPKVCLIKLGSLCGELTIHYMNSVVSYIEVGRWMAARGFYTSKRCDGPRDVFEAIATEVAGKKALYLEFGVASGDSIRHWSRLIKNEESSLHGFDSFEGLPLDWNPKSRKGAFSTGGAIPEIADPRVKFFKGWFEETLPPYVFPSYEALVINIDCDLYSPTAFVLTSLREHIRPGTYLYFDEFCDRGNELKAFDDFIVSTGKRFRLVAASKIFRNVAFQCLE